ncbi:MAG TPA: tail fiber domain-containing protein [Candidatus Dojkabacteria bacterium]|nr:tail fiber domain-containing protein [Candidatus Dojkabacteria bacterium]
MKKYLSILIVIIFSALLLVTGITFEKYLSSAQKNDVKTESVLGVQTTPLKGDQGEKGLQGKPGIQGLKGDMGPKGDKGDIGLPGLPGINGLNGEKGEIGMTGPQGEIGPKGEKGEKGDQGIPGSVGLKGDQGIPGPIGPKGDTGQQGEKGDPAPIQTFSAGVLGNDFNISTNGTINTFNLPDASNIARGLVNTTNQVFSGQKTLTNPLLLAAVIQGDSSITDSKQLLIRGTTDSNQQLEIGYNTVGDYASIQAIRQSSNFKTIALNPLGGNVGIGNTNPQTKLHIGSTVVGDGSSLIKLEDVNSLCNINANTGTPSCGSDLTLKKDITSLNTLELLNKIIQLRPVSYHWKTDNISSALQYGFIAQEVEQQFPELVKEDLWIDGTKKKFLNIDGLIPYIVGAIKEQQNQIIDLKKEITDLKNNMH